jgi:hypothetical protein
MIAPSGQHNRSVQSEVPTEGSTVARKTIFVSDLSGEAIQDGKGARVLITFGDARKGTIVLDITDEEAE